MRILKASGPQGLRTVWENEQNKIYMPLNRVLQNAPGWFEFVKGTSTLLGFWSSALSYVYLDWSNIPKAHEANSRIVVKNDSLMKGGERRLTQAELSSRQSTVSYLNIQHSNCPERPEKRMLLLFDTNRVWQLTRVQDLSETKKYYFSGLWNEYLGLWRIGKQCLDWWTTVSAVSVRWTDYRLGRKEKNAPRLALQAIL